MEVWKTIHADYEYEGKVSLTVETNLTQKKVVFSSGESIWTTLDKLANFAYAFEDEARDRERRQGSKHG